MPILGIDEVGRGPLAGPLVMGAVVLPASRPDWANDLKDSKQLTAKKRENLNEIILREAPVAALGWVTASELNALGMSAALRLCCRRAVKSAQLQSRQNHSNFSEIIIDGPVNFLSETALSPFVTTLIKGDALIPEISAASIIAKVARDRYMQDVATDYPEYGFEKHVGYGTAAHRQALQKFGPCPEHRTCFRGVVAEPVKNTTSLGSTAESKVADFLVADGHFIIARNHKTKFYEIDIISAKDRTLYFTEVKYRKDQSRGTSLDQITPQKLQQMRFAAEAYLKYRPDLKDFNPALAAAAVSGPDFIIDDWFPLAQD